MSLLRSGIFYQGKHVVPHEEDGVVGKYQGFEWHVHPPQQVKKYREENIDRKYYSGMLYLKLKIGTN